MEDFMNIFSLLTGDNQQKIACVAQVLADPGSTVDIHGGIVKIKSALPPDVVDTAAAALADFLKDF